ncbi:MAG: vWA domain-containing protein [Planctomycetota bacterium]
MNTRIKQYRLRQRKTRSDRAGAMLPLIALVMVILFVAACMAVDIARIHTTRSELRTATDAAARAGVEALGRLQDPNAAVDAAVQVAALNQVAGQGLTLDRSQIELGTSELGPDGTFQFVPGGQILNSVRVTGSRTASSPDGPVGLFIGPIFGVETFEPSQFATATRLDRDIALVLDVSGSMSSRGRFAGLQNALNIFLTELENSPQRERCSLVVYSSTDRKLTDLTDNLQQIRTDFSTQRPSGATAIGQGLQNGLNSVLNDPGSRPFALKSIVVMTDGRHNRGVNPAQIAPLCRDAGVTVHTITFSRGANQALMRTVADIADGTHIHADNNNQLGDAFREIAQQLSVMLTE